MGFRLSLIQAASVIGVSTLFSSQVAAAPFEDIVSQPFFPRENSNTNYTLNLTTGGTWTSGFAKAQALVDQMTIEEKVNVTTGYTGKCVGFSGEVPRLGLRGLCLQDGPLGVRPARRVSQFPAGVTVSASFDRDLMAKRAEAIAEEFRDKGVNIWLGPVTGGPLGRAARGGRNWEGFGSDEYLHGEASYLSVKHAQEKGVLTCAKHYIAYEQETFRNPYNLTEPYSIFDPLEQNPISSNMDDKTLHEVYLRPFSEAVRAGSGTIMCAYNQVNGTTACGDDHSLNKILKGELNFQGAVISDWGGTFDTIKDSQGGLDVTMPGTGYAGIFGAFFGDELVQAVKNDSVSETRLNDMVLRLLAPALEHQDLDTWPQPQFDVRDLTLPTNNVRGDHHKIIKKIGEESITLLKNEGGLPLKAKENIQSIAIIGQDAGDNLVGWTSCGQTGACGEDAFNGTLTSSGGCEFREEDRRHSKELEEEAAPSSHSSSLFLPIVTLPIHLHSQKAGWAFPPYTISPLAAIQNYVRSAGPDININLENFNTSGAIAQAAASEVAIVFANTWAREGADRQNLTLWANGDSLIKDVAAVNNNTIVIIHAPGPVLVEEWIEHENITAVLFAYLPGQEGGNSLPGVLFGEKSPSGKLPFTMGKQESDWSPNGIVSDAVLEPQANFDEKLLVDYKWFDAKNITPRFEFGFGLSYSTFEFGDASISKAFKSDSTSIQPTAEKFAQDEFKGESLYDEILEVKVEVTNSGDVDAAEVAQLYVQFPESANEPPSLLRGFEKLWLSAGESKTATFPLRRKDVSVWSTLAQRWEIPSGDITFKVGSSSRDFKTSTKWSKA